MRTREKKGADRVRVREGDTEIEGGYRFTPERESQTLVGGDDTHTLGGYTGRGRLLLLNLAGQSPQGERERGLFF